jgi:hypothetical protein
MVSIEDIRGMTDEEYLEAIDAEDFVVDPLVKAACEVADALQGVEDYPVDNAEQRRYIRLQIDDMMYELRKIRSRVEG